MGNYGRHPEDVGKKCEKVMKIYFDGLNKIPKNHQQPSSI
jgi:hypothetical protein|tara:strand:+ start:566 stop:685 length:120 start_codon:yes stop_codon:yes gene_type:complete